MAREAISFPDLSGRDRLRAMLGVVVIGVIFVAVVSRLVLTPVDPLGCVSTLSCKLEWWILPICAALALVFAALVSIISGAKLEEMGVFAVALGLSLAVLRHESAAFLWATQGQANDKLRTVLAGQMAAEALGWFAVIGAAYAGTRWAVRVFDLKPLIEQDPANEYRVGALTVLFMCVVAMLALQVLSAGSELAPIETGQVCFAVAASFYLASLVAYQVTGAQSHVWAYLAVGLVAVAGYAWTALNPTPEFPGRVITHYAHFSPTVFGRALPIQTVMVGTAAAVFGNWHQRQLTRFAVIEDAKA
ncbi:MAG: hypothetical protein IID34_02930 [Planctomycetes bacterium]|nr:hypothetical protein [Planctomycetota bacterium]MCH8964448.1 hypothetical protein [Planctomycetota bacterium]